MQALIIEKSKFDNLRQDIEDLKNMFSSMENFRKSNESKLVYTNKEVQEILGVGDKLIRQYRKKGLLGYSQEGDKFFYQEKDILQFLDKHYHKAYAYEYN
ncbi:MAG: helix-turn-helix domain-containing protein [Dysgonomonas sp.]|uniref:helix-turn-helix domain-containing protein n=1 Tax=Dysgonomonas sp. TaxID=1891233 RepID=UPI003A8C4D29